MSNLPKPVTRDQFTRDGGRATHEPTGATFLRSGKGVVNYDWCLAGLVPGAVYDPAEIMDMAQTLLVVGEGPNLVVEEPEKMDEVLRDCPL
jgi:hypothetical protein